MPDPFSDPEFQDRLRKLLRMLGSDQDQEAWKRGAMPQWYKQKNGIRGKAQSGAARVARFRPRRLGA